MGGEDDDKGAGDTAPILWIVMGLTGVGYRQR